MSEDLQSYAAQEITGVPESILRRVPQHRGIRMEAGKKGGRRKAQRTPAKQRLESQIYEMQVRICKALANPTRLHMLDLLGKRSYTVSGLCHELGISPASVSVQLATLKSAGVVVTRKEGRQVYCSLAIPEVRRACHFIRRVLRAQVRNAQRLSV